MAKRNEAKAMAEAPIHILLLASFDDIDFSILTLIFLTFEIIDALPEKYGVPQFPVRLYLY
jgi:hypothetical protein